MEMEIKSQLVDIHSETSTSAETSSTKLGTCEVCAFKNAKYTCPRCEVKTCSLNCNKIHKLEVECNGERDRTKFIPLNKFSNLDLSSDYRMLEEIFRSLESSKKNFGSRKTFIPHGLIKLGYAAKSRKIQLKFLPFKFVRRKNNTTRLESKSDIIFWHIEWVFVNADNLRLYDVNVLETQELSSVLKKYLKVGDASLGEKLQYYQAVGMSGIRLLLKAEQKSGKKFYEIDGNITLKECLENKVIIEYPTIHVVLKDHGFGYNIIDSDDEESNTDDKVKSGNQVVNNIITKAESDENKSMKNLLFLSEYSGEEISDSD